MKLSVNEAKLTGLWAWELCCYSAGFEFKICLRTREVIGTRNGPQSRRSTPRPPDLLLLQSSTVPSELVLPWLYYQYLKNIYRQFYKIFCSKCTFFNLSWKLFDTQILLRWPIYDFQHTNTIQLHDSIKSIHVIFFQWCNLCLFLK